jgi:hypothetical protein
VRPLLTSYVQEGHSGRAESSLGVQWTESVDLVELVTRDSEGGGQGKESVRRWHPLPSNGSEDVAITGKCKVLPVDV